MVNDFYNGDMNIHDMHKITYDVTCIHVYVNIMIEYDEYSEYRI